MDTIPVKTGLLLLHLVPSKTNIVVADAARIRIVNLTSAKEISENPGIRFYPNPAKHALTISGDQSLSKYSLEVFNQYGCKIFHQKSLAGTIVRLDMSDYSPGVYMVKLSDGNGRQVVRKIVKE